MKVTALLLLCGVVFGLGQRVSVRKARIFAANQMYTPIQIKNATKQQILSATGLTDLNEIKEFVRYWAGIKIFLLKDAVERRTQERLILFRQQLIATYPNAVGLDTPYAKDLAKQLLPLLYGDDPNEI